MKYNEFFTQSLSLARTKLLPILDSIQTQQAFTERDERGNGWDIYFLNSNHEFATSIDQIAMITGFPVRGHVRERNEIVLTSDDCLELKKRISNFSRPLLSSRSTLSESRLVNRNPTAAFSPPRKSRFEGAFSPPRESRFDRAFTLPAANRPFPIAERDLSPPKNHSTYIRHVAPVPEKNELAKRSLSPRILPQRELGIPATFHNSPFRRSHYSEKATCDFHELVKQEYNIDLPGTSEMEEVIRMRLRQSPVDPVLDAISKTNDITTPFAAYLYLLGYNLIVFKNQGQTLVEYPSKSKGLPNISVYQEGDTLHAVQSTIDVTEATGRLDLSSGRYKIDISYPGETTLYYSVPLSGPERICFGEPFHPFDLKRNLICSKARYAALFATLEEAQAANNESSQTFIGTVNERMFNPFAPSKIVYVLRGVPRHVFDAVVQGQTKQIEAYLTGCIYQEPNTEQINWKSMDFRGSAVSFEEVPNDLQIGDYCNVFNYLTSLDEFKHLQTYLYSKNRESLLEDYMEMTRSGDILTIRCVDARTNPSVPRPDKAQFLAAALQGYLPGIQIELSDEKLIIAGGENINRLIKVLAVKPRQPQPLFFQRASSSAAPQASHSSSSTTQRTMLTAPRAVPISTVLGITADLRDYLASFDAQSAPFASTIHQLGIDSEEAKYFCPLAQDVPNKPVRVAGMLFDFDWLMALPANQNGTRKNPLTEREFRLDQIQPAYDCKAEIKAIIAQKAISNQALHLR